MGTKFIPPVIDLGLHVIAFSEGKLPGEKNCCLIVKDVKTMVYLFPSEIDSCSYLKSAEHAHSFCRCVRSSTFSFLDDISSKYTLGLVGV